MRKELDHLLKNEWQICKMCVTMSEEPTVRLKISQKSDGDIFKIKIVCLCGTEELTPWWHWLAVGRYGG